MSVEVLRAKHEIRAARRELRRRGLSCRTPWWRRVAVRLRLTREVLVGDQIKSWDVLRTAVFMDRHLPKGSPILDIGAYASEILCALRKLGFTRLVGLDLNPDLIRMPHSGAIRYEVGDFTHAPFETGSFAAVTAISVIEHGFDARHLLREVSRLLRPGGYFIASFDYWPTKIDTDGVRIFGMGWRIFSEADVRALLTEAEQHDLWPVGPVDLPARTAPVRHEGRSYTFAWCVLRKGAAPADGAPSVAS